MQLARASRERLMLAPSRSFLPSFFVSWARSDPARSTRHSRHGSAASRQVRGLVPAWSVAVHQMQVATVRQGLGGNGCVVRVSRHPINSHSSPLPCPAVGMPHAMSSPLFMHPPYPLRPYSTAIVRPLPS